MNPTILLICLVVFSTTVFGQSDKTNTFENATLEIGVTKPKEWIFLTAAQLAKNEENFRLQDDELRQRLIKQSKGPVVRMAKYPEPFDDVNPNLSIRIRSREGLQTTDPKELVEQFMRALGNQFEDFKITQPAKNTELSGLKAGNMKINYTMTVADGRKFPTAVETWVIPREDDVVIVGLETRQDEKTGGRKEFDDILESLKLGESSDAPTKKLRTSEKPFLKQSKMVPAGVEWSREVTSRIGGTIRFRVTSPKPFGLTVVTEKAYKDMMAGVKRRFGSEDVYLTMDCKEPVFDRNIQVKAGSSYIIIENQSDEKVKIELECFPGDRGSHVRTLQ